MPSSVTDKSRTLAKQGKWDKAVALLAKAESRGHDVDEERKFALLEYITFLAKQMQFDEMYKLCFTYGIWGCYRVTAGLADGSSRPYTVVDVFGGALDSAASFHPNETIEWCLDQGFVLDAAHLSITQRDYERALEILTALGPNTDMSKRYVFREDESWESLTHWLRFMCQRRESPACPSCGQKPPSQAAFCPKCGSKLASAKREQRAKKRRKSGD